ncbi:MAG: hypothetical protein ACRDLB_00250 [Actinomycetota bacterium]
MHPIRDERGIIGSWLLKLLVVTSIVGVILFDAGSIAVNFFGLDATADDVAVSLANRVSQSSGRSISPAQLEAEAKVLAKDADARLVAVQFDDQNNVVSVTLRRNANTLIVGRVGPIEDWARATAEAKADTQ